MTGWVLIVHILGGGTTEMFASEAGCRLALEEARIVWRWERGRTSPAASCRRDGGPWVRRERPRHIVRAMT